MVIWKTICFKDGIQEIIIEIIFIKETIFDHD